MMQSDDISKKILSKYYAFFLKTIEKNIELYLHQFIGRILAECLNLLIRFGFFKALHSKYAKKS